MAKLFSKLRRNSSRQVRDAATRVAHGRVISSHFFRRYLFQTVFIVSLLLVYIANRYDCVTGMETISRLSNECQMVKTELQSERSKYMTSVRESAIQQKADSLQLDLSIQKQPPYKLTYAPQ